MIRIGVVGPGIIWHRGHKHAVTALPEMFQVTAFCSRSEDRRRAAAAEFPGARCFDDYHALAASDALDAVLVATPIALNAAVSLRALEHGKHVFVEKPMATSTSDAHAIVAAARCAGRTVFVMEQAVHAPVWAEARAIIESGAIGRPVMFDRLQHGYIGPERDPTGYGATDWRRKADYPLGSLFDGGIHHIAAHALLFGAPASVYATAQQCRPDYGRYDNVCMVFDYKSGMSGFFSHSSFLNGRRGYFHVRGTDGLLVIDGASIGIEPKSGEAQTRDIQQEDLHVRMWCHFADCIRTGAEPCYTAADALRDIATLEAVAQSVAERAVIDIRTT